MAASEPLRILVIDPGSTSTKAGVYAGSAEGGSFCTRTAIPHPKKQIEAFGDVMEQEEMRYSAVNAWLSQEELADRTGARLGIRPGAKHGGSLGELQEAKAFDAVVGRGGLLKPLPGGTYWVNETMLEHLRRGIGGRHASNLGGILAYRFAGIFGAAAFIVDPVVVDEMDPMARLSGLRAIQRRSVFHALNQKAVSRRVAERLGRRYEETNLVVCHLGGGISVGAHKKGRVVDVNNALDGDGPFSPERAGSLPVDGLLAFLKTQDMDIDGMLETVSRRGGLFSYTGEVDLIRVVDRIEKGDETAKLALAGMAYQVAKEIAAMTAVLEGDVDGIVLTGGGAFCEPLVSMLERRVRFLAPIHVIPGELELEALAEGAIRVLSGGEKPREYPG